MRREEKIAGRSATNDEWAKHLRPYSKRRANKATRKAAKKAARKEIAE